MDYRSCHFLFYQNHTCLYKFLIKLKNNCTAQYIQGVADKLSVDCSREMKTDYNIVSFKRIFIYISQFSE